VLDEVEHSYYFKATVGIGQKGRVLDLAAKNPVETEQMRARLRTKLRHLDGERIPSKLLSQFRQKTGCGPAVEKAGLASERRRRGK
jgi:hypothetical protein